MKRITAFTAALFLVLGIACASGFAQDDTMKQNTMSGQNDTMMSGKKTMRKKHRMMKRHHRTRKHRHHKRRMMMKKSSMK